MNKVIDGYSPVESTTTRATGIGAEYNYNWDEIYRYGGYQTGWVCPVCGRVNAPWLPYCPCDGKLGSYTTTTDSTDYKPTESEYETKRNNYMSKYQEELNKILDMLGE